MEELGKTLIGIGFFIVFVGAVIWLGGRFGLPTRLPGDIIIEKPGIKFYFPLGWSILLSIALSLVLWLFRR